MPQTLYALNTVDAVVEISTDNSTWTDISGTSNKIDPPEASADTGSVATLEGQYKITRAGKFNAVEIPVTIVYSENPSGGEAFDILHAQSAKAGRPIYLRWTPGGSNGEYRYFTANANDKKEAGRISKLQFPGADAETAAPTVLAFTVVCTKIGRERLSVTPSASVSPSASASA